MPEVGERVIYYPTLEDPVFARVIAVTFWDLVDLEFTDGVVLRDVRRVVILSDSPDIDEINEATLGRWQRIGR